MIECGKGSKAFSAFLNLVLSEGNFMRILIVEDQRDLNEIIARKLRNENYSVDACFDGEDALDYIRGAEYDAVVLDIMLPGITGIGVLKQMRLSGDKIPVLLFTALEGIAVRLQEHRCARREEWLVLAVHVGHERGDD